MIKNSKRKIDFIKNNFFGVKVSELSGNILELGYDFGNNFKYYNSTCNVIAVDKKNNEVSLNENINIINKDILANLPFDNNHFDHIVFSFFLCTISDKDSMINEMYRVLKNEGQIIYIEHIASNNTLYHSTQILISPLTKILFNGCSLNNSIKPYFEKKFKLIERKQINNHIEPYEYAIWKKHST